MLEGLEGRNCKKNMKLHDNLYFKHKYKDKHFLKIQRKL